jgi:hypothetical protein
MIKRDYILRMLAEFVEALSRIRSFQKGQLWDKASQLTDEQFNELVGLDAQAVTQLSDTELMARVIQGESTLAVREKTLILATLLKEAGDTAAGQSQEVESQSYYLKGLHLLLGVLAREEISDFPDFVPRIDDFLGALGNTDLPLETQAMLMQHFEKVGDFAKAEDMLFSMIEDAPDNVALLDFGVTFYQRIKGHSDDSLMTGNLPRSEVDAGYSQLLARKKAFLLSPKEAPG